MKSVYSAPNIAVVGIYKSILEGNGIRCWLKNEFLSAAMGELPPIECWPQLCVDDEDYTEAQRVLAEAISPGETIPWRCPSCGEEIEGEFCECWKCGKERPL
jgi:hypothetical protein